MNQEDNKQEAAQIAETPETVESTPPVAEETIVEPETVDSTPAEENISEEPVAEEVVGAETPSEAVESEPELMPEPEQAIPAAASVKPGAKVYDDHGAAWYVVYTMGYEDKIKQQILKRADNMEATEKIFDVHVPKKTVSKVKGGKRVEKDISQYQRYVFVNMILEDLTYRVVRNTPGVLSIIERPLSQVEVARIFGRKKQSFSEAQDKDVEYTVDFSEGDEVRIEGGAFDGFTGKAESIDAEHGKVTVMISVFGRLTPVDLTIDQVQPVADY